MNDSSVSSISESNDSSSSDDDAPLNVAKCKDDEKDKKDVTPLQQKKTVSSSDDDAPLNAAKCKDDEKDKKDVTPLQQKNTESSSDDDAPLVKNVAKYDGDKFSPTVIVQDVVVHSNNNTPIKNEKEGSLESSISSSEDLSSAGNKIEEKTKSKNKKKSSSVTAKGSSGDNKGVKGDSRKLSNLKRYLKLCGVRVSNYAKLFEDERSMKAKERKLQSMLEEIGMRDRPTIAKCKKIRMRREEKQEIAELDQSCIISDERRTRRSKSNVKDKTSIKKSRLKYDFGDLSVNSDCSDEGKSGGDEFEQPDRQPYQKRKILESSSDDDDDSKTSFRHKRIKATTEDEIDDSQ